jgi:phospholipid/cholesterol/gamma-HCH transport system ATP-binding protein
MTVQDNIMFPLDMFTNLTFTEKKRVREVMGRVHLENAEKNSLPKFLVECKNG